MLPIDLLIGLGIFLFGMLQLERSIEALSSRWMKRWLAKSTHHASVSVFSGTIITALVQSSSMVSLIVMAFASAGIIPLFNAIGILLGANLGTTFTGWIVTTLGFKLNLTAVALPAIGIGCFIQIFSHKQSKIKASGILLFGLGLLLFGLGIMKDAVEGLPQQLDLNQLQHISILGYLLVGIVLTAVIQSSSATMMIALAALHSGIVDLSGAAVLVIGANLGTTSTTILGSLKGSPVKRQLALAHVIFNIVVSFLALFLLLPLLPATLKWLNIEDPLFSLVTFHSIFNLLGLFLFVPILSPYTQWVSRFFIIGIRPESLHDVPTLVPDAAISACQQHSKALLCSALALNLRNLRIDTPPLQLSTEANSLLEDHNKEPHSFEWRYEDLKQREGDLVCYTAKLQQGPLDDDQSRAINTILNCARDAVYGVKTLKDIRQNLIELRHSLAPDLQHISSEYQNKLKPFYKTILELLASEHDRSYLNEQLTQLTQCNEQLHQQLHDEIISQHDLNAIEPELLSTLLNINREIWYSGRNLIQSLQAWYDLNDRPHE